MKSLLLGVVLLFGAFSAHADLFDLFKKKAEATNANPAALAGFSQDQVADALKQALGKGVSSAITNLGQPGGFLNNPKVKIVMGMVRMIRMGFTTTFEIEMSAATSKA